MAGNALKALDTKDATLAVRTPEAVRLLEAGIVVLLRYQEDRELAVGACDALRLIADPHIGNLRQHLAKSGGPRGAREVTALTEACAVALAVASDAASARAFAAGWLCTLAEVLVNHRGIQCRKVGAAAREAGDLAVAALRVSSMEALRRPEMASPTAFSGNNDNLWVPDDPAGRSLHRCALGYMGLIMNGHADSLVRVGALDAIAEAIERYPQEPFVLHLGGEGMKLLLHHHADSARGPLLGEDGAVAVTVAVLLRPSAMPVSVNALVIIRELAARPRNRLRAIALGAVEAIRGAAAAHAGDVKVQEAAESALRAVLKTEPGRHGRAEDADEADVLLGRFRRESLTAPRSSLSGAIVAAAVPPQSSHQGACCKLTSLPMSNLSVAARRSQLPLLRSSVQSLREHGDASTCQDFKKLIR